MDNNYNKKNSFLTYMQVLARAAVVISAIILATLSPFLVFYGLTSLSLYMPGISFLSDGFFPSYVVWFKFFIIGLLFTYLFIFVLDKVLDKKNTLINHIIESILLYSIASLYVFAYSALTQEIEFNKAGLIYIAGCLVAVILLIGSLYDWINNKFPKKEKKQEE